MPDSDFDSIKIGVCDIFWMGPAAVVETFLGLTKGGCELTYTPEWHDLQVDQYGNTVVDSVLIGEAVMVKAPLAETSMDKLAMFSHTGTELLTVPPTPVRYKVTFGRFPGLRLSTKCGRLRLHPIAMGADFTEDIIIYRAASRAPLQLNYKLDAESIYETEFHGMVMRANGTGAFLWEIGDASKDLLGLPATPVPTNEYEFDLT